jgi:acyl carrier protein
MNGLTPADVRVFLKEYLDRKLTANGRSAVQDLPENCDLLLSGMIDSIGLLELVTALQKFAGREIDFEILDPEEMTIVGPLCRFVSEQAASAAEARSGE